MCVCVCVNITYPERQWKQKKSAFKTQSIACYMFMTLEGDKMLKHINSQCTAFCLKVYFFLEFTWKMPLLRQSGPIFTHHFTDYSLRHKLPTASYRHRARSTVEGHKRAGGFRTTGHLGLNAQWSGTFLKLHVTELPVTQLHNRTQKGWKKCNFNLFFLFF